MAWKYCIHYLVSFVLYTPPHNLTVINRNTLKEQLKGLVFCHMFISHLFNSLLVKLFLFQTLKLKIKLAHGCQLEFND